MSHSYDLIKSAIKIKRQPEGKVPPFSNLFLREANVFYDRYDKSTPFDQFQRCSRNMPQSICTTLKHSSLLKNSSSQSYDTRNKKTMTHTFTPMLTPFQKIRLYQQKQKDLIRNKALMNTSPQQHNGIVLNYIYDNNSVTKHCALNKDKAIQKREYSLNCILRQKELCSFQSHTSKNTGKGPLRLCIKKNLSGLEIQTQITTVSDSNKRDNKARSSHHHRDKIKTMRLNKAFPQKRLIYSKSKAFYSCLHSIS